MLVAEHRPRTLNWFHAGPLLFGDWGTSRLYVLGLAFYYTGHASPIFLGVMSLIMIGVAWAYTIVCRVFPDGGGAYAAARSVNPLLSVIAATLLLADYIVTAALSLVEGFHYVNAPDRFIVGLCIGTVFALGIINWFGARSAARFALIVALLALAASAIIGALSVPWAIKGAQTVTPHIDGVGTWWTRWESLVRIVLALSGVEAVANMSGLMKQPVAKTAKRTIWPVLIEVVLLNTIFGLALNAMPTLVDQKTPDYVKYEVREKVAPDQIPDAVKEYRDTGVKLLATETAQARFGEKAGSAFGVGAGIVFGMLLLSAANTAIMAMVSVMYSLAQDKEIPKIFAKLNYSGVPWVGLIVACILPAVLLPISSDAKVLSELYAIGVVGAIAINFTCCAWNKALPIKPWERKGLWFLGGLMTLVEVTIVVAKPNATVFATVLIGAVLAMRFVIRSRTARAEVVGMPVPAQGWLEAIKSAEMRLDPDKPRIMLAARGRSNAEYAVDLARQRGAVLFAMYVRTLRVIDVRPDQIPRVEDDPGGQEALGTVAVLAKEAGVPFVPIYVTATDIAGEILDYTVTYGCDRLILGKSRRSLFSRRVAGDVVREITEQLPEGITLITRSGDRPYEPGTAREQAETGTDRRES